MARIQLVDLAHARSGDKGDTANVGVIAYDSAHYVLLREALTPERVKAHFRGMVGGKVERFELPNLHALNFLLHNALDGGGTLSLMTDAQGKVYSTALLRMEIEVPDAVAEVARGRGRLGSAAADLPGSSGAGSGDDAAARDVAREPRAPGPSAPGAGR